MAPRASPWRRNRPDDRPDELAVLRWRLGTSRARAARSLRFGRLRGRGAALPLDPAALDRRGACPGLADLVCRLLLEKKKRSTEILISPVGPPYRSRPSAIATCREHPLDV